LKYISKDDIHAYSIDEFIIDVTTYLKLYKVRAREFAEKLMDEVYENCHIPLTCGIGTNMYLAKVALGITAKHSKGRVAWLNEEKFNRTLANHRPLTDFWGLSRGISSHLARLGIYDMEGILDCDPELLYKEFGVNAELLIDHARGYEPVTMKDVKNYERKSRSFSSGQVFGCGKTKKQARLIFMEMIENLSISLAKDRQVTDLVALSARLESGEPIHGSIRLSNRTSLPKYMRNDALTLFDSIVPYDELITGLYVGFGDVTDESKEYYDLFTDMSEVEKDKAVRESMLDISGKYGKNSVLLAHDFSEDATQRERNEMIGGHYGGKE
jgi:DNA polymerase V